jgi:hypothetical protein
MHVEREYHGVPLWVLRDYLIDLGGKVISEACIRGEGGSATFREGEPFTLGMFLLGIYVVITRHALQKTVVPSMNDQFFLSMRGRLQCTPLHFFPLPFLSIVFSQCSTM